MKKFALITAAAGMLISTLAFATTPEIKISVIDLQKIMREAPQAKEVSEKLTKKFKPRQEHLASAQKHLQDEMNKMKRDGTVMSATERTKLQTKIVTDKRDFQRLQEDFRQDLNVAQNQSIQKVMGTIHEVVDTIAKKENYDLILQKDAVPFASERVEITAQVLKQLKKIA